MERNIGITLCFRYDVILIRNKTIKDLQMPKYIHVLINEDEKAVFIQKCEYDQDAFEVRFEHLKKDGSLLMYYKINAKPLLRYFARLLGVGFDSESFWFSGILLDDGVTVYVDLKKYQIIPYDKMKTLN